MSENLSGSCAIINSSSIGNATPFSYVNVLCDFF